MIEIKQVKTQDEVNYTFVEKLMHTACLLYTSPSPRDRG